MGYLYTKSLNQGPPQENFGDWFPNVYKIRYGVKTTIYESKDKKSK